MSSRRILIIGGSTRAAADSVRRAGWQPICADYFADLDLKATAEVIPVSNYPDSIPDDVAHVHADGWFYCGAIENRPDIVERMSSPIARYGPLLGTPAKTLRLVRNPLWLCETLRATGIDMLDVRDSTNVPPSDGHWIQKPLSSAGGRSIRNWNQTARESDLTEPCYFQERAPGIALSALFDFHEATARWLGASRELTTTDFIQPTREQHPVAPPPKIWQAPSEFSYVGSCGPLELLNVTSDGWHAPNGWHALVRAWSSTSSPSPRHSNHSILRDQNSPFQTIQSQANRIAAALAAAAPQLKGIVGLDFRFDGHTTWLTEVNPRYTASVEVIELARGQSLLNPYTEPLPNHSRHQIVAKRILYASTALKVPDLSHYQTERQPWDIPAIADIPQPGLTIEPGWPICTVMASGPDEPTVQRTITEQINHIAYDLERTKGPAVPIARGGRPR